MSLRVIRYNKVQKLTAKNINAYEQKQLLMQS